MRTVLRGAPGTEADQTAVGRWLDEKDGDLIVGPPGGQDGLGEIRDGWHFPSPLRFRAQA